MYAQKMDVVQRSLIFHLRFKGEGLGHSHGVDTKENSHQQVPIRPFIKKTIANASKSKIVREYEAPSLKSISAGSKYQACVT
jgi:hypothetical protein